MGFTVWAPSVFSLELKLGHIEAGSRRLPILGCHKRLATSHADTRSVPKCFVSFVGLERCEMVTTRFIALLAVFKASIGAGTAEKSGFNVFDGCCKLVDLYNLLGRLLEKVRTFFKPIVFPVVLIGCLGCGVLHSSRRGMGASCA